MLTQRSHEGIEVRVLRDDGTAYNEHQVVHISPNNQETSTCRVDITPGETFSIDIRLHACVLNNYHHGSYRFKTRIAGTEVDDVIDHSSSRTYRHHNISLSQIRAAYKLKHAGQVCPASPDPGNTRPITSPVDDNERGTFQIDIEAGRMCRHGAGPRPASNGSSLEDGVEQQHILERTGNADTTVNPQGKATNSLYWKPLDANPYHSFIFKYRTEAEVRPHNAIEPVRPITPVERHPRSTCPDPRSVLELNPVAPHPTPISQVSQKRKRSDGDIGDNDEDADNDDGRSTIKEMYGAMLSMNRKITRLEKTMNEMKEQLKPKGPEVIDMTGNDSDSD